MSTKMQSVRQTMILNKLCLFDLLTFRLSVSASVRVLGGAGCAVAQVPLLSFGPFSSEAVVNVHILGAVAVLLG